MVGSRRCLVTSVVAAAALAALIATTAASAASRPNTVPLKVKITGLGTVRVTGSGSFTCREYPCVHTFHVQRGRRIAVTATAAKDWKRTTWTGACKGSGTTCRLRLEGWRTTAVWFVPPGHWLNPYPLGKAATLWTPWGNWRVQVNSATIDATAEVEAVVDPETGDHPNPALPQGEQYTVANVSLTYVGSGSSDVQGLLVGALGAQGVASGLFPPDYCEPPQSDVGTVGEVSSGQTVTGNLCYVIDSDDASTLRLNGVAPGPTSTEYLVWFAIR